MLQIWGRLSSINVRKVVWCAQELKLEFQRRDAGGKYGGLHTPEYLARNPNALIPVIDDDDFDPLVLWESNVIVRYLCAKYSTGELYPEPLKSRFDAERWMDWQQTTLNRASAQAFVQLVRTPHAQRNPDLIRESVNSTEPLLALLDSHLAERPFMCGARFTMADIPLGCEAHRWFGLPSSDYKRPRWPHLERWFAALRDRPGARGVLDLKLE
ncbi:MAG: glutathione S-transferase [Polyangiales bacterium]